MCFVRGALLQIQKMDDLKEEEKIEGERGSSNVTFYIFSFDLETTGLIVSKHEIIQTGFTVLRVVIDVVNGVVISVDHLKSKFEKDEVKPCITKWTFFDQLSKPECPTLDPVVIDLTKITMNMLNGKPDFGIVSQQMLTWMDTLCGPDDIRVLIGQNIFKFDIPLMANELYRRGSSKTANDFFRMMKISTCIDTLPMAKLLVDTKKLMRVDKHVSYSLGSIFKAVMSTKENSHKIKGFNNAHNAVADCNAVLDIVQTNQLWPDLVQHLYNPSKKQQTFAIDFIKLTRACVRKCYDDDPKNNIMVNFGDYFMDFKKKRKTVSAPNATKRNEKTKKRRKEI